MSATVCSPDVHGVRRWGGRRTRGGGGETVMEHGERETVNEAFLGSSEGLSTESSSLDLTRKTERDLS